MAKSIKKRRGKYKKPMKVEYVYVKVPDFEERLERVFNMIFQKVATELTKEQKKK